MWFQLQFQFQFKSTNKRRKNTARERERLNGNLHKIMAAGGWIGSVNEVESWREIPLFWQINSSLVGHFDEQHGKNKTRFKTTCRCAFVQRSVVHIHSFFRFGLDRLSLLCYFSVPFFRVFSTCVWKSAEMNPTVELGICLKHWPNEAWIIFSLE